MKIFLDDVRLPPTGWMVVRNATDFKHAVSVNCKSIDKISFDHDLGLEETGHDLAKWMIESILDGMLPLNPNIELTVHSANPVGAKNILGCFGDIKSLLNKSVQPKLTIIRGIPGSGKSTMASKISQETGAQHYEADMFFELSGTYQFNPQLLSVAHQWCQLMTKTSLEAGKDVVVSNTFTRRWEMQPYLDLAKTYKAEVEIIQATGQFQNIHNVPEDVIVKMKARWED